MKVKSFYYIETDVDKKKSAQCEIYQGLQVCMERWLIASDEEMCWAEGSKGEKCGKGGWEIPRRDSSAAGTCQKAVQHTMFCTMLDILKETPKKHKSQQPTLTCEVKWVKW